MVMNDINSSRCASCSAWKDPKLTHKMQEDGLIAPPVKQGTGWNPTGSYDRQVTESQDTCASFKPTMLNG